MSVTLTLKEYDEMQENKRLLTAQNEELKALHEKIEILQKEKIEALQANEHNVTITETKHVFQHAYIERPEYEIVRRLEQMGIRLNVSPISAKSVTEYLLGCSYDFREVQSFSEGTKDKVYSVALTEMRARLRKEVKDEIDQDTKKKLDAFDEISEKLALEKAAHKRTSKSSETMIDNLEKDLAAKVKDIENKDATIKEQKEKIDQFVKDIKQIKKDYNTAYVAELVNLVTELEKETRVIPWFGGAETSKKVNSKLRTFMADHKMKKYE